jgi:hypothetical protein
MVGGGPYDFDPDEYSENTARAVYIATVSATDTELTPDEPSTKSLRGS